MQQYGYRSNGNFLSNIPVGVKYLLVINILIFIVQKISAGGGFVIYGWFSQKFSLDFNDVVQAFYVWQIFTYMFLHADFMHLLFNMLGLFMLGVPLETFWGTKRIIYYYLFSGLVAGSLVITIDFFKILFIGQMLDLPPTLGASGAIFGLLLAYALYYPERQILVFFVFPVKIKNFIIWTIVLSFVFIPLGLLSFISHTGHLGGILGGYLYHRFNRRDYHFNTGNNTLDSFFLFVASRLGFRQKKNVYSFEEESFLQKSRDKIRGVFTKKSVRKKETDTLNENKMTDYQIESKIDELLDKISSKGLRGLSMDEQLFLDRVSKLYRHKFPD